MKALGSIAITLLAAAFFSISSNGQSESIPKRLHNFHKVNDHIYRGAQPSEAGIRELKDLGVKTVISLRDADKNAAIQKRLVESQDMKFINVPLSKWSRPAIADIEKIVTMLKDVSSGPIYLYCHHGADRTGTVIAIYRMLIDGWTYKAAVAEAESHGLSWWQWRMRDFIKDFHRERILKGSRTMPGIA